MNKLTKSMAKNTQFRLLKVVKVRVLYSC